MYGHLFLRVRCPPVERKNAETFETRRWPAAGAEKGWGDSQAKHVNTERTRFARSEVGVRGLAPALCLGGCLQPGPGPAGTPRLLQRRGPGQRAGRNPRREARTRPRFLRGEGSWRKEWWRGVLADFTSRRKAFVGCSAGRHHARGAAQGAAITWLPAAGSAAAGGGARAQPSRARTRLDLALVPWPNPVSTSRAEEKPLSPRLRRLLLPLAGYFQARSPPHRGILLSISHYGFKVH